MTVKSFLKKAAIRLGIIGAVFVLFLAASVLFGLIFSTDFTTSLTFVGVIGLCALIVDLLYRDVIDLP